MISISASRKSFREGGVSRPLHIPLSRRIIFAWVLVLTFAALVARAQTIHVDITPDHVANKFIPNQALGAGIDRMPAPAIDKLFTEEALQKVLSAGWQPVSYRQNTELHIEAWHWNPKGAWSDPSGKGYFTSSSEPTEIIRHSYGYPLPHRGATRNDGTDATGYGRLTDGDVNTYWKSNPYLTRMFTGEDDSSRGGSRITSRRTDSPWGNKGNLADSSGSTGSMSGAAEADTNAGASSPSTRR